MAENTEANNLSDDKKSTVQTTEHENKNEANPLDMLKDVSKTSADIEKEKKQFNSGIQNVKGNQPENLFAIQNLVINGGVSAGQYTVREILRNSGKVDKDYDLSNAEQFAEFGEKVKAGEYFAVSVILCVFEYVELDDLPDLKLKLLTELPKVTDEEGKEIAVYQNAYISTNSLLKTVKGEMVVLESGEHCVRLGVNRQIALKNLWQQFSEMRVNIARWLLNVSDSFEYRTNFDATQIASAFVNILKLDFNAGVHHFFPRLYSKSDKYWLLGFVALELYNDTDYRDKILPHIINWTDSSSSWLWKSAIYVYANIKNNEYNSELDKKIYKSLTNWISPLKYDNLHNENLQYIAVLMIGSESLRTIVSNVFNQLVIDTHNYNKKILNSLCYLDLLRYGYYCVSSQVIALPLVVCDNRQQLENLLTLLEITVSNYNTRQLLFITLELYLKEISNYNVEKKLLNRIKAYFQIIVERNHIYRNDIYIFLKKCECTLAKELLKFLEVFLQ